MYLYCDERTGQFAFVKPIVLENKDSRIWREFLSFHRQHPEIYEHLKCKCFDAIREGRSKISIQLLIEIHRWIDPNVKIKRINNNHAACYARIFLEEYPQYRGFFELRKIKSRQA